MESKKFWTKKSFTVFLSFFGLYLISAGISWVGFSFLINDTASGFVSEGLDSDRSKITVDLPKTQECPINGQFYTEPEKAIWETRRPIAAMVENHHESRPPSGISKADVIYEAVAEGGITRFMGIFYCGVSAEDVRIAPIRSARVYYIDYASEYGKQPIFMHVGGANDYAGLGETAKEARALELLETIGWRYPKGNDFDTTYDSGFPVFWRNYERLDRQVSTEHTMMASIDKAYEQAEKRGFSFTDQDGNAWNENFVSWSFREGSPSDFPSAPKISFEFWENSQFSKEYSVAWTYDPSTNSYFRENGGEKHIDLEYNTQLSTKNVVIILTKERRSVDKKGHVLYDTIGSGKALIFNDGNVIKGTWEKKSRFSRTMFYDENGDEVKFVRGNIWIHLLSLTNNIDY